MFGLWSAAADSAPSVVCYCKRTQHTAAWLAGEQRRSEILHGGELGAMGGLSNSDGRPRPREFFFKFNVEI